MLISLIVPIYNVKQYFEEFINSVERQTFLDFQVVLVDDGSNDGTEKMVDLCASDPRYKVIHKENGGIISAWKRGVLEADGEYLAFADPDDILDEKMMEHFQDILQTERPDMIVAGYYDMYPDRTIRQLPATKPMKNKIYMDQELATIKENLFGNINDKQNFLFFVRWNKVFRKKIFVDNLAFSDNRIKFGEDVCVTASAIYDSKSIFFSDVPIYYYRRRENSLTTISFTPAEIDNVVILIGCIEKLLKAKGYMNKYVQYKVPAWYIVYLLRKIIDGKTPKKQKKENLILLKGHALVRNFNIKMAKPYIMSKQYYAITALKSKFSSLLLTLGKRS